MRKKKRRGGGGLNTLTSCISTTLVLILLGTVVFFVSMGESLSRSLLENFSVNVLLSDSIPQREARDMQIELGKMACVKRVAYTSKERATREQAETLGTDPSEFLGYSPIPASFELHLKAEYANRDSLTRYMPAVKKHPYVTDVIYPEDTMNSVNRNIRVVSIVLLTVALLLAMVSVALINNTMRLAISRHRHAIYTMKLVGAKRSFIRRPFMIRAFWMGFAAGLMADAALYAGMRMLVQWDEGISALITPPIVGITLGTTVLAGLLLTMICSYFSVNKNLNVKAERLYLG